MAPDPYRYFRIEAREILEGFGRAVLDLEKGPSPDLVAKLLRLAHTLKGAARVVKQREIADLAHASEELLGPFRGVAEAVPRVAIDALLAIVDRIAAQVAALTAPEAPQSPRPAVAPVAPALPLAPPVAVAPALPVAPAAPPRERAPVVAPFVPSPPVAAAPGPGPLTEVVEPDAEPADAGLDTDGVDGLLDGVAESHAQLALLRGSFAQIERAQRLAERFALHWMAPAGGAGSNHAAVLAPERARILAEELKSLLDGAERGFTPAVERIERELTQVRDHAERLRLAPVATVFTALQRTVRDAAQVLGREAAFSAGGGEVRLDAQVLGTVQRALVQMVRNAVAHGIEPAAARLAAGKPPRGRVTLEVARRGRQVVFTVGDDGRGIDLEAVRLALQRSGALAPGASPGRDELLRLLLAGGISTAGAVTEVAGRGIGLDVVREAAERLNGSAKLATDPGRGTRVELVVPWSLAAIEALLVEAGGVVAAIPRDAVRRTLRIAERDLSRTPDGEAVMLDGATIPFLALGRVLAPAEAAARPAAAFQWSACVVGAGARSVVVGVDRLLGMANVVVRPLPAGTPAAAVVAGAALDAEGDPLLVLDPDALAAEAARLPASAPVEEAPPVPVLVIDDSLTTRMLEQSILEAAGYAVDTAVSGEEGLEQARRKPYALILVDVEMPGMDGFTFIERIRADPALHRTPAFLVTSRAAAEDRRRGELVGATAYIVKSEFDQGELLARIRRLVG